MLCWGTNAVRTAPSLLEVQRAWQRAIAAGDFAAAVPHLTADPIPAQECLAVYRNTARATLVNALLLAYPAVRKLVGGEFFEGAAHAFLAEHWAGTTWLDEYGAAFPDFLRTFEPLRAHPPLAAYLPDVASLERAVNHALHAPEAPPLDLCDLASLSPADLERLQFDPQPSIGFVRTLTPADSIWSAVLTGDDDGMHAIDLGEGPVHLLVEWRIGVDHDRRADEDGDGARLHLERMGDAEWRFAQALCGGIPLRDALAESTARDPGFAATTTLATHLAAGRFCGFRFA